MPYNGTPQSSVPQEFPLARVDGGVPARAGKSGSKIVQDVCLDHPFGACSEIFALLLIAYPLHQGA
eukprot:1892480-Prymnesium_polylepis.1